MWPEWFDPTGLMGDPLEMVKTVAAGAGIGVIGGLFGISGCFMLVPVLAEVLGVPYAFAVGSGSAHAVGIAATGLRRHLRRGTVDLRLGLSVATGAGAGALLGSQVLAQLRHFWDDPVRLDMTIRLVYLALLAFVAFMILRPSRGAGHVAFLQRLRGGPRWPVPGETEQTFSAVGGVAAAFAAGCVVGFLGLGGGVIYLPLLILAVGAQPHNAVRVSFIVVLCSAVFSTIGHAWAQHVSLALTMLLMVGSSLGVQFGAALCRRVHGEGLKRYFGLVVLASMGLVAWKLIANLFT